jgi:hypothetical protein
VAVKRTAGIVDVSPQLAALLRRHAAGAVAAAAGGVLAPGLAAQIAAQIAVIRAHALAHLLALGAIAPPHSATHGATAMAASAWLGERRRRCREQRRKENDGTRQFQVAYLP